MELLLEDPRPGDLIELFLENHWAVYVGDGDSKTYSLQYGIKVVKQEPLEDVVGISPYSVNNHLDDQCPPLSEDEILRRAKEKIGSQVGKSAEDKAFVTHLRHGVAYITEFYKEPELGDLIEIFHSNYKQWAIAVEDGYVVHLAPPASSSYMTEGNLFNPPLYMSKKVKLSAFKDVVHSSPYRVNNYLDDRHDPLPVSTILSRANAIFGKNIEKYVGQKKFVTTLRYGVA